MLEQTTMTAQKGLQQLEKQRKIMFGKAHIIAEELRYAPLIPEHKQKIIEHADDALFWLDRHTEKLQKSEFDTPMQTDIRTALLQNYARGREMADLIQNKLVIDQKESAMRLLPEYVEQVEGQMSKKWKANLVQTVRAGRKVQEGTDIERQVLIGATEMRAWQEMFRTLVSTIDAVGTVDDLNIALTELDRLEEEVLEQGYHEEADIELLMSIQTIMRAPKVEAIEMDISE